MLRSCRTILLRPTRFSDKRIRYVLVAPSSNKDVWQDGEVHGSEVECDAIPDYQQVPTAHCLFRCAERTRDSVLVLVCHSRNCDYF